MYQINFSNSPKKYTLPESWSEVSADQFKSLITIVREEEDMEIAKLLVLKSWAKLSSALFKDLTQFFISESESELVPLIAPFFEDAGFERNIMQKIEVPGAGTYFGFSDRLENVSAAEYSMAVYYYDIITRKVEDRENLVNFVATFYRPMRTDGIGPGDEAWNGDYRIPYNEENIATWAANLTRLDNETLFSIRVCFERVMKWMGELPNFSLLFNGVQDSKNSFADFDRVLAGISGESLGSLTHVRSLPILTVFNKLQWLQEEYVANKSNTLKSNIQAL